MADRVLPSRYMQVERNDDHPLAWFTPDGKGWVPVDGADPSAIDYEAAWGYARHEDDGGSRHDEHVCLDKVDVFATVDAAIGDGG